MGRSLAGAFILLVALAAPALADKMPGVDLKGLKAGEIEALTTLLKEGACPCQPKLSLHECVVAETCPAATELAAFGAGRFRDGLGAEEVREAVVKKYISDNVSFTFDLESAPKKGAPDGKVKIVEFADFECPHCAEVRNVLADVLKAYPTDVTVYFKQFPIAFHMYAEAAARASLAAGKQGKFWEMHDLIFENQRKLDEGSFETFATELGLNVEKFKADMASAAISQQVQKDKQEGIDANLTGTPTLFINGKLYLEDKTADALKKHIADLLKAAK